MSRIKVAFCIPDMIIGGTESVFVSTIDELAKNNDVRISIVTHTKIREPLYVNWLKTHPEIPVYVYYPLHNFFEDLNKYCTFFPIKEIRRITFSLYKKYRRAVLRRRAFTDADIIIDYKNYEFFRELRKIKDKPIITWMHSALSYFEKYGYGARFGHYTRIVGITDEFVTKFKEHYPQYADKIVRIYNPINVQGIIDKAQSVSVPQGKYFCHVSRLVDGKDIETLMDAFDIFAKKHNDIKLYIIGDGYKTNDFRQYANTLKSKDRIIFTGAMDNPYGIMRGAIANILSSEYEGFGMVLIESQALGTLCISSNCTSGPTEILQNGNAGMLFPIGDKNALAHCMHETIARPTDAQAMITAAAHGLDRFAVTPICTQIKQMIMDTYTDFKNKGQTNENV